MRIRFLVFSSSMGATVMSRGLLLFICCLFILSNKTYSQGFKKINSGTKADIQQCFVDDQKKCFFLTDKIYRWDSTDLQKLNFPVNGKIFRFYPVSKDDIWFSISQETYTSLLYHYHDGILENIPSPFTNVISYIHFHDKDFGLFCCTSEVAYYKNGVFGHLAPSPTRNSIEKIYGEDESKCWALSFAGELYLYQKGNYKQYYAGEVVRDFSFRNSDEGCLLMENKIIRLRNTVPEVLVEDKRIKHARKILLTASGDIILAGIDGIILEFKNGQLRQLPSNCNENFESISE